MENKKTFETELKFIDELNSQNKFKVELVEDKGIDAF